MRRITSIISAGVFAFGAVLQGGKFFLDWAGRFFAMRDLTHIGDWVPQYIGAGGQIAPWVLMASGLGSLFVLHVIPRLKKLRRNDPFASVQIRMQPRGSGDPFEVIAKIDGLRRQNGVTILVKYAEAIHGLSEVYWEWSQSYRVMENGSILPNETLQLPIFLRLNDGEDEVCGAGWKSYKVGDGIMLLIEVRVVAESDALIERSAFLFRNIQGARLSEPCRLDELGYIDKLDN